jgi:hypothetical protein
MLHFLKRIDWLVGIVVVIAGVSFLSSLFVLFLPWFGLPNEIQNRAAVSQALSVALALVVGMIAIIITAGVESSEYRAREKLKSDIASLIAALQSIYLKTANFLASSELRIERPNFKSELKTIGEFVCSTSGFAFFCWAAEKSKQAGKGRPEFWRLFFYDLSWLQMRSGSELIQFVQAARPGSGSGNDPLHLLFLLTKKDLRAILKYLDKFEDSLTTSQTIIDENPIVAAMWSPSQKTDSAPLPLPSAERIEAALAAARARGGNFETEFKEILARARTGDRDEINLFNYVADYLLTNT